MSNYCYLRAQRNWQALGRLRRFVPHLADVVVDIVGVADVDAAAANAVADDAAAHAHWGDHQDVLRGARLSVNAGGAGCCLGRQGSDQDRYPTWWCRYAAAPLGTPRDLACFCRGDKKKQKIRAKVRC